MDAETEQHVEEAKRPPAAAPMRRLGANGLLADQDLSSDIFDPAVKLARMRENRTKERLEKKLDKLVPVESITVTDGTVFDHEGEEIEHYDGPAFRIRANCLNCKVEIIVDTIEEPGLQARAVAAGVLRRRPGAFKCEECASREEAEAERAEGQARQRQRVDDSQLPEAMRGFRFGQMKYENGRDLTIRAARDWADKELPSPKRGLCIFGPKGAGKTRLAATATWQRLHNWPVAWVSWPVLLAQLGAAFNDSARAKAIAVIGGKGALVIDDIAQEADEKVSDWAKRQIFAAVDRRIQVGAPILITTNIGPKAIGEVFGEKLMSRIVGYCRVLELPGQDMRLTMTFDGSETLEEAKQRALEEEAAREGMQEPEEDD